MADCRTEAGDTQDTCNILQRKKVEKRREEEGKGKTKGKGRKEKKQETCLKPDVNYGKCSEMPKGIPRGKTGYH